MADLPTRTRHGRQSYQFRRTGEGFLSYQWVSGPGPPPPSALPAAPKLGTWTSVGHADPTNVLCLRFRCDRGDPSRGRLPFRSGTGYNHGVARGCQLPEFPVHSWQAAYVHRGRGGPTAAAAPGRRPPRLQPVRRRNAEIRSWTRHLDNQPKTRPGRPCARLVAAAPGSRQLGAGGRPRLAEPALTAGLALHPSSSIGPPR